MKKLMITAATAAMIGGAFADAQVYDWTLNVKTTEAKVATVKAACEDCDGATSYRKQTSMKISGIYWGCTCSELVGVTGPVDENYGIFFWNGTKKAAFYDQDAQAYIQPEFAWDLIQRIGQKADEVEAVWNITLGDFYLVGAGFGKAKGCDESTYVSTLSGNFAGTFKAGNGCKRCQIASGSAWTLCDCGGADERTAAYGTWSMKYNSSKTKKFEGSEDWSWNKWEGDTLEALLSIIEGGSKKTEECEKAEANVAAIQKEIKGYTDKVAETTAAYNATTTAVNEAWYDYQNPKQSALWIGGTNDTDNALKEYLTKKAAFKVMLSAPAYADIVTNPEVAAAGTNYWADAQTYLKAAAQLDAGLRTDTNEVNEAKIKVANDYMVLDNAIAKVPAGETTKATLKAGLQACYDAAEVYFDTAVKYVYLYTYPEVLKDMPDYSTVSSWTTNQLLAKYNELVKEQKPKKDAMDAANAAWAANSTRLNAQLGTAQAYLEMVCD